MSKRTEAKKFAESLVPPAPPSPDEVAAKALNVVGEVGDTVFESPLRKITNAITSIGSWMRGRTKENL